MLPQSHLAVIARNVAWTGPGEVATEPHEVGWAKEAVIFVRLLKPAAWPHGPHPLAVEISPDGMHWAPHGTTIALPKDETEMTVARVTHFGGWLRVAGPMHDGESITVLVSLHLKA
ncbi:hypothetical protein [Falsiroseomonas sp. HW251]|uniref:hypothetical protein n=1 Tax=Falsiroseomonas sp. HW251 TaxID=3390998 RepID=UPI003D32303B